MTCNTLNEFVLTESCVICQGYFHEYACAHGIELDKKAVSRLDAYLNTDNMQYTNMKSIIDRGLTHLCFALDSSLSQLLKDKKNVTKFESRFNAVYTKLMSQVVCIEDFEKVFRTFLALTFNVYNFESFDIVINALMRAPMDLTNTVVRADVTKFSDVHQRVKLMTYLSIDSCMGYITNTEGLRNDLYSDGAYDVYVFKLGFCGAFYLAIKKHKCVISFTKVSKDSNKNIVVFTHKAADRVAVMSAVKARYYPLKLVSNFVVDESVYDEAFSVIADQQLASSATPIIAHVLKFMLVNDNYIFGQEHLQLISDFVTVAIFYKYGYIKKTLQLIEVYEKLITSIMSAIGADDRDVGLVAEEVYEEGYGELIDEFAKIYNKRKRDHKDTLYLMSLAVIISRYSNYRQIPDYISLALEEANSQNILIVYSWFLLKMQGIDVFNDNNNDSYVIYRSLLSEHLDIDDYVAFSEFILKFKSEIITSREIPWEFRHLLLFKPQFRFEVLFRLQFRRSLDINVLAQFVHANKHLLVDNYDTVLHEWYDTSKIVYKMAGLLQSVLFKYI